MKQNRKVFIIAEAGVNHNGSMKIAKRLVDVAVRSGCDAVKFQTFKAERLVAQDESQFEMLRRLELSRSDFREIAFYCKRRHITFMSTPFDEESVDLLDDLGMMIFKVPSGEVTNKPLIQHIAEKKRPIILSTGMSYLEEVKRAVGWIDEIWQRFSERPRLTILHCVSDYPARPEDMNLLAMKTLDEAFGVDIGLSDHTLGIEVSLAAVALGAKAIEKHFTLDRDMNGPDHKASLEPDELIEMVKAIRNVEMALGNGTKKPVESELKTREVVRKSLVAARDIKAGRIITRKDIAAKRPGTGLSPDLIDRAVNRRARIDIKKDMVFDEPTHFC